MPSTPRGYPYPLDTDMIDVAGDIMRLAQAVDSSMTTEINQRAAGDTAVTNNVKVTANVSGVQRTDNILIQAGWYVGITDGYNGFVIPLPITYGNGWYIPQAMMGSHSNHQAQPLDNTHKLPHQFRVNVRSWATNTPAGAGNYIGVWWVTIGGLW